MTGDTRTALLQWFDRSARDLPWRGCDDPYAILVSEVMSQQTRVDTVRQYWSRWLERFPTIESLAVAESEEVMRYWAGLGYYRRARNLHACAREVVQSHDGKLPADSDHLRGLPGIGAYTAAAVASIAFGEPVAAIDGNVTRVVSRLFMIGGDPGRAAFRNAIAEAAATLVESDRAGDSNEGLMELGAVCCTPTSPRCEECPVESWCQARAAGAVDDYPPKKARKPPRPESRYTVVAVRDEQVFVRLREGDGLLAGLWEFPTFALDSAEAAVEAASQGHNLRGEVHEVGVVEHIFSHIRMSYHVIELAAEDVVVRDGEWTPVQQIDELGMSTAMRRVAAIVPRLSE